MSDDRPILFSAPMVRAILARQKTVTRRVVKPAAGEQSRWLTSELLASSPSAVVCSNGTGILGAQMEHPKGGPLAWVRCPYDSEGNRLWVRETWRLGGDGVFWYAADMRDWQIARAHPWRPSIHMPRRASRLSLDVASVGVQRLHDITDADAEREGICGWSKDGVLFKYGPADDEGDGPIWPWRDCPRTPRDAFIRLWAEINGQASWDANPWVWRVEFARVEVSRA